MCFVSTAQHKHWRTSRRWHAGWLVSEVGPDGGVVEFVERVDEGGAVELSKELIDELIASFACGWPGSVEEAGGFVGVAGVDEVEHGAPEFGVAP